MNKITDKVKNFYEEIKFPNYDDDNLTSIIMKGRKNLFIKKIIEEIPSKYTNYRDRMWDRPIIKFPKCNYE